MSTIIATYNVAPGNEDAVADLLADYTTMVLTEPGCIAFDVFQGRDDPCRFILVEQYDDQAAIDAHIAAPHFTDVAINQIRPLLAGREVEFLHKL